MTEPESLAEAELIAIRQVCATAVTVNDTDSTMDTVARVVQLAWPDTAARTWFKNWQMCARRLRELGEVPPTLITSPSLAHLQEKYDLD